MTGQPDGPPAHGSAPAGVPAATAPAGLAAWIGRIRAALAAQADDVGRRAIAFAMTHEPRHYDDQSWNRASTRIWTRTADGRNHGWALGLDHAEDHPRLKAALGRAAETLGGRSWRYRLDVGATHATLSCGDATAERPLLLITGPGMPEAAAGAAMLAVVARTGATLATLGMAAFPDDALTPAAREAARAALRHHRDPGVRTWVTRLRDGALALHVIQLGVRDEPRFGTVIAVVTPADRGARDRSRPDHDMSGLPLLEPKASAVHAAVPLEDVKGDGPTRWSNTAGWVDAASDDRFTDAERAALTPPAGGRWHRIQEPDRGRDTDAGRDAAGTPVDDSREGPR